MFRPLSLIVFLFGTWIATSSLRPAEAQPAPMEAVGLSPCAAAGCGDAVAMARKPKPKKPPGGNSSGPNLQVYASANFAPGQLAAHYNKHQKDWTSGITQADYLAKARTLLSSAPSANILQKVRPNGDVLHYNQSANEFAVGTASGIIRTLFRPTGGIGYWNQQ